MSTTALRTMARAYEAYVGSQSIIDAAMGVAVFRDCLLENWTRHSRVRESGFCPGSALLETHRSRTGLRPRSHKKPRVPCYEPLHVVLARLVESEYARKQTRALHRSQNKKRARRVVKRAKKVERRNEPSVASIKYPA